MRHLLSRAFILCVLVIATVSGASAEIYRGIGPLDTLGSVKAKLPSATYERLKPAWARPEDALYAVSGEGISGTIIIKFNDSRPLFRQLLATATKAEDKKMFEGLAKETDEEAFSVEWVRWMPDSPIPLQRFISKYGEPEQRGFSDEDMQPYRLWKTKGIAAYLSDSESFVLRVDFDFTRDEMREAYQAKYGFIPDFLK